MNRIARWIDRLKWKETPEQKENNDRITRLHKMRNFSYLQEVSFENEQNYRLNVSLIRGMHRQGQEGCAYDCNGREVCHVMILHAYEKEQEEAPKLIQGENEVTVVVELIKGKESDLFRSQYFTSKD